MGSQSEEWGTLDTDRANGCIRDLEHAYTKDGGLAVLFGNIAQDGCVVKTAGVDESLWHFEGPAVVFDSQEDACEGILGGKVKKGDCVVITHEGPKGGPGMQEMLYPTSYIKSMHMGKECALITDGRFSGGTSGLSIGHISPEAASGGNIGKIKDGDIIEIDIPNRSINVKLSDEELATRPQQPLKRNRVVSKAALFDYTRGEKKCFDHILVRHEQAATHAAEGYARVSGKVGVALVTSGPGVTNTLTGIADAMLDSTPIVVIAGQVAIAALGTDAFQEVDLVGVSQPISKWSYQIRHAEDVAWAVSRAFYIARSGRPGPVVLDFARNAQVEQFDWEPKKVDFIRSFVPYPKFDPDSVRQAAELINQCKASTGTGRAGRRIG